MPGHTKCCTCHAKSSQQTWRSDAPKCNHSQEINDRLWWTCLLYCACHGKCIFPDFLQISHACHRFLKCYKTQRFAYFRQRAQSLAPATQNDIWASKSAPTPQFFTLLTSKCASRHNGVHFSTSQLPKVVRTWCALYILTSKCASRHSTLRGRRGTISYPPSFQVQAWRNVTSTFVLRGRRGIYGTGWHAWARFGCAWRRGTLRGRRGTWWHLRSFHVAGVALHHIYFRFAWQAWRLSDIHLGFTDHLTHIFVTHHLSHTIFVTHHLSQCVVTQHLSYNLCQQFSHAHLCNTPSSRLPPQTHHHLSHTLRHIPSFTHNFVAHRLSHTIFHKSLWLKQKRLEQKTFWTSNSCFVCRHVYLAASPACLPRCIPLCHTQLF